MRWTEARVLDAVEAHFDAIAPSMMLRQVECRDENMRMRRLDGVVVSDTLDARVAIEAKTSRADYRNETPSKRSAAERIGHTCYYAAPIDVIPIDTLPDGWGLLEVHDDGVSLVAPAQMRWPAPLPDSWVRLLMWRTAATERRLRDPQTLREERGALSLEVERLQSLLGDRDMALAREKKRAQDAAEQVMAVVGDAACSEPACGKPITYTRINGWRHESRVVDTECEALRAETERRRRETLTGAAYIPVPAPRVTPAGVTTEH